MKAKLGRLLIVLGVGVGIVFVPYWFGILIKDYFFYYDENGVFDYWARGGFAILTGGALFWIIIIILRCLIKYIIKGN